MLHTFWVTFLYQPLYNLLFLGINLMPGFDVGLAVIALTLLVKIILFPLTQKSIESQLAMKRLEPQITQIKKEIKDTTEQNKKIFELYKEHKANPFSGCLLMLIQFPILITLYLVCTHGFDQTTVSLYSFITKPAYLNLNFLGLVDITSKSIVLALIAALTQLAQGLLMKGRQNTPQGDGMQAQIGKIMQTQMVFAIPVLIFYVAYRFSSAVALYLITSNIVTVVQELYTKRKIRKQKAIA